MDEHESTVLLARGVFWFVWIAFAVIVGLATRSGILGASVGLLIALLVAGLLETTSKRRRNQSE
jgi:hypothetical protein